MTEVARIGGIAIRHPDGKLMRKNAAGQCCCLSCDTPSPNDCVAGEAGNLPVTLGLEESPADANDFITKISPGTWSAGLGEPDISTLFDISEAVNPCQTLLDQVALHPPDGGSIYLKYDNTEQRIDITRQYFPVENKTAVKWSVSIFYEWYSDVSDDVFDAQCQYQGCDFYPGDVCLTDSPVIATINALYPPNTLVIV